MSKLELLRELFSSQPKHFWFDTVAFLLLVCDLDVFLFRRCDEYDKCADYLWYLYCTGACDEEEEFNVSALVNEN
jgi:hypothetical protein